METLPLKDYTTRDSCRSCDGKDLVDVMSLGEQYLPGWTDKEVKATKVPLELVFCQMCSLLQLRHTTRPELLWNEHYGYKSGVNATMRAHLQGITDEVSAIASPKKGDIVVDIGCNDGTLLDSYHKRGLIRVGFDPSSNVAKEASDRLIQPGKDNATIFVDFFRKEPFLKIFDGRKAQVVSAISMFYDLENPNTFLSDVREILDPDGVLVIQQNYLGGMLEQGAFDNICHEHLEYYSLESMENLLDQNGMEVFDVTKQDLNGGSFRTYIKHKGSRRFSVSGINRIAQMRRWEEEHGLASVKTYFDFAKNVQQSADQLTDFVEAEVAKGRSFYIYGASTRGSTLLQTARLDCRQISGAAERNPDKYGKKTVGTNIPIVSEAEARAAHPDYFLVLPWFFRDEFVQREQEYLDNGGKLVFPLPKFEVVGK